MFFSGFSATRRFVKDYMYFYKTPRGYHKRSGNSNDGWNVVGCQSFLNMPLLAFANEIETPVLLVHGEKAHSRYFSEYAFEKMTGVAVKGESRKVGNKELLIVPGAVHCDLYDDVAGEDGLGVLDGAVGNRRAGFDETGVDLAARPRETLALPLGVALPEDLGVVSLARRTSPAFYLPDAISWNCWIVMLTFEKLTGGSGMAGLRSVVGW